MKGSNRLDRVMLFKERLEPVEAREASIRTAIQSLASQVGSDLEKKIAEIRTMFTTLDRAIWELSQFAREQDLESDTQDGIKLARHHEANKKSLETLFRQAVFSANRTNQQRASSAREDLLRGGEEALRRRRSEYDPLATAQEITSALQRTHSILASEVDRSTAIQGLAASTSRSIKESHQVSTEFGGRLAAARKALKAYDWHHKQETWMLGAAIVFFASVCILILAMRLPTRTVYRVARWGLRSTWGMGKWGLGWMAATKNATSLAVNVTMSNTTNITTTTTTGGGSGGVNIPADITPTSTQLNPPLPVITTPPPNPAAQPPLAASSPTPAAPVAAPPPAVKPLSSPPAPSIMSDDL
ncbi:hypothetical protein PAPYR_2138 [Paratrimastix pyriformis]|uniref:Sec20 C-terminal domain-containing protein n=1 Tax=Paratrimastix pyriformis TaxID=342808 RepID=A0ABQ8UQW5_9EUKA|nr:hypothetical protein PAPYR_2138 [Paratrimastix pyriformis]